MVARTVTLPNIRKFFVPDPGYTIVEADLQRAETQVVAWEADEPELKKIFQSGTDVHTENARLIYGDPVDYYRRDRLKRCIYAIQNGAKPPKIGELLNDRAKGVKFYNYWTGRFPKIKTWHGKLEFEIQTRRCVSNIWGYKLHWFDRIGESIIGDVVPWITQSTIAITINKGAVALNENLPDEVELLLQVHDALLFQVRTERFKLLLPEIRKHLSIVVPYPDPLIIPVTMKSSEVSWGDAEDVPEAA